MKFTQIDSLNSWPEIKDCLDAFMGDWVFRGQREASWALTSSLERATSRIPLQMAEQVVYRQFKRNMHNYLGSHEIPADLVECFALMQHHGAPTRLLDFTHSPYVAAFFAIEDAIDDGGSCAVWAIDVWWCKLQAQIAIRKHLNSDPAFQNFRITTNSWHPEAFQRLFVDERIPLVAPVEPFRRNVRITIQNGLFLCPAYVNRTFEENLGEYDQSEIEKRVVKIIIPNKARVEVLTDLNYMNINRATLFPGIDGFSQSLKQAILDMEDHGQIGRRHAKRQSFGRPPFN